MNRHAPLGPGNTWKTGQRVYASGLYVDQFGVTSWHDAGATFPPTVGFGRKGEVAYRRLVKAAATA